MKTKELKIIPNGIIKKCFKCGEKFADVNNPFQTCCLNCWIRMEELKRKIKIGELLR